MPSKVTAARVNVRKRKNEPEIPGGNGNGNGNGKAHPNGNGNGNGHHDVVHVSRGTDARSRWYCCIIGVRASAMVLKLGIGEPVLRVCNSGKHGGTLWTHRQ